MSSSMPALLGSDKSETKKRGLTSCVDKVRVEARREQRVWQVPKELLQQTCDAVDVMVEALGVGEVHL